MIYTVISHDFVRNIESVHIPISADNSIVCSSRLSEIDGKYKEDRDCRVLRQPLPDLPKDIQEYISSTKNDEVRAERRLAYITLLCSLSLFFGIDDVEINRDSFGKPFIKHSGNKQIFISISHSDGTVAVSLSDEGDIGVDLQTETDKKRAEKLDGRFLQGFKTENQFIPISYYHCTIENDLVFFIEIFPADAKEEGFTERWSALESLLKLDGGGFSSLSKIKKIKDSAKTNIKILDLDIKKYSLSTSIKK
nr:hypothetical protein [Oscillospiraceae bacterium]